MNQFFMLCLVFLTLSSTAFAIPNLQLGINGGSYLNETTIASGNSFDLYAYLLPNTSNQINDTYFLSAALIKKDQGTIPNSVASLGSFKIGESTIIATGDMNYGTPPINDLYPDLSSHGIFPTFYTETSFTFAGSTLLPQAINTADNDTNKFDMYRQTFSIDLSGLTEGYGIHFDLYNLNAYLMKKQDLQYDLSEFAPYSHDAEGMATRPSEVVPEPGTIILFGLGLAGVALFARRKRS
jgi:hypothetical protein